MSGQTSIEWTQGDDGKAGATWNPVTGCTEVSEGCDNCYARVFTERFRGVPGHPFEQGFDVRLWPERLMLPLRWRRARRVFVNSVSDLFHAAVPTEFIAQVVAVMVAAPQHTFQVLTKRQGRMAALLRSEAFWVLVSAELGRLWNAPPPAPLRALPPWIWIGVSVETQRWADVRLPTLMSIPAGVRFASCEPLLGPLDLSRWLGSGLGWVIAGGESGPRARPMHPDWPRALRDQCREADVPFFFKQRGQWTWSAPDRGKPKAFVRAAVDSDAWLEMWRVGKGAAGRDLDGQTWSEFPQLAA